MPLERVTDGLFDYAGMFAPASLTFEEALRESAKFPSTLRDPDLVAADMVLTADQLKKIGDDSLVAAGYAGRPCRICLVGIKIEEAEAACHEAVSFNAARRQNPVVQQIVSIEIQFTDAAADEVIGKMEAARKTVGKDIQLFLEPNWDNARLKSEIATYFAMVDDLNHESPKVGVKVRCAGPTAVSHRTLASVMAKVNRRSIPLKLTQGLHHAFAGDPNHGNQHGFLNCVFGIRLQRDTNMTIDDLAECLADSEPSNFVWDEGIRWRNHEVTIQSIVESSVAVPFTIGSCSLSEPDAELKKMGR